MTAQARLQAAMDAFVSDMAAAIRQAVREASAAAPARETRSSSLRRSAAPEEKKVRRTRGKTVDPEKLLSYIRNNPGVGLKDLMQVTSASPTQVRFALNKLKSAGSIRMEGTRRLAVYHPKGIVVRGRPSREAASSAES